MKKGRSLLARSLVDGVVAGAETGSGAPRVVFWLLPVFGEGLTWLSVGASRTAYRLDTNRDVVPLGLGICCGKGSGVKSRNR